MELTKSEALALKLVTAVPEAVQKVITPDGAVEVNKLYRFFRDLSRGLELSEAKRKGSFHDVTASTISDTVDAQSTDVEVRSSESQAGS